jgi:isopropylmalate/homocitrate/citramalate synthase
MYGLDTGIRTDRFFDLSALVMSLAGVTQPSNRPVVGERLYNVESGIISTWVRNVGHELTESFPYRPELVGQPTPLLVLGKGSGLDSIAAALDRLGRTATPEQSEALLAEVKGRSLASKGLIDDETFLTILDDVTR